MGDARSAGTEPRKAAANDLASGRFTRAGADGLWLVRATRDHLAVAWSALPGAVVWQVVCWDSHDAAVGGLRLTERHRRATFARLAGLRQPFTIAVSGLGPDGSVLWQRGLADLYLRADQTSSDERVAMVGALKVVVEGASSDSWQQSESYAQSSRRPLR